MRKYRHILLYLICLSSCLACSTTRRLGNNDILYTGVKKIEIASNPEMNIPGSVESAVKEPLSVKPNNPLYSPYIRTPFPMGLWAWNYLYTERKTGFKSWLFRKLSKDPVLISNVQPQLRVGLVEDILDNLGYFGSTASYEVIQKRNPKKARLNYRIEIAEPWFYDSISFPAVKDPITKAIDTMKYSSNLKVGQQYNIDTLTRERTRIANRLREESYYYFQPEYLEYLADTTQARHKVDLRMVLAQGIPPTALQPYDIGDITISLLNEGEWSKPDTMSYRGIRIQYQPPLKIRPNILSKALVTIPGEPSRVSNINSTLTNLTRLGIFRYVNMEVTPLDSLKAGDPINLRITAAYDQPLQADLEVDFSHKSSSFIGPGLIFSVKHKNIFHGGEVLAVRFNGAYEWQTGNKSAGSAISMNSYEFGINSSLIFPRLVAPGFIRRNEYPARTGYNLGVNLMRRSQYFTITSFNSSISYDFQTSPASSHNITILKFVYNNMLKTEPLFDSIMLNHPALRRSFENQFIPSASYTYTWLKSLGREKQDQLLWSSTITSAGNILSGLWSLAGWKKPGEIFGNQFSQFVKVTSEIRYYKKLGRKNTLAMRFYAGAALPYDNLNVLPYTEQFYIGGANSIRAFTIRSIGPGSYNPLTNEKDDNGYFDQTGEMKLEANIELRFGIAGRLQGAVFLDAGNIWLLRKDKGDGTANNPGRPGGEFRGKDFLETIATGTGAGLRYDLSFLVVRFDVGVGIHLPYDTGKHGYYNIPKFKDGLGYHFAIGYPF